MDMRVTPEPTDSERAAIVEALERSRDGTIDERSAWLEAALAEGVAAAEEHGSEPTL